MSSIIIKEEELRGIQQRFSALYDIVVNTQYSSENIFSETNADSANKGLEVLTSVEAIINLFSEIVKKTDIYLGMTIKGFQSVDKRKANEFKID